MDRKTLILCNACEGTGVIIRKDNFYKQRICSYCNATGRLWEIITTSYEPYIDNKDDGQEGNAADC